MTLPENRQPLSWDDVQGVKHQNYSTWEAEARALLLKLHEAESRASWAEMTKNRATEETKALREVKAALIEERDRALAWRDKDWEASQENTALRARVATLEALLTNICDEYDLQPWGPVLHQISEARAALQQEAKP